MQQTGQYGLDMWQPSSQCQVTPGVGQVIAGAADVLLGVNLLEERIGLLESSLTEEEQGFAENKKGSCVICSLHESIIGALLKRIVSRSVVLKTCVQRGKLKGKSTVPVVLSSALLHRTVQHLSRSLGVAGLAVRLGKQACRLELDLIDAW